MSSDRSPILRHIIACATLILFYHFANAQPELADSIITSQKLKAIVEQLASDSLTGRNWATEGGQKAAEIIASKMKAIGLKRAMGNIGYFSDVDVINKRGDTLKNVRNIVGVLPGKSRAAEVVLFTCHYDHLGTFNQHYNDNKLVKWPVFFEPIERDTIYNGANDDASGVAAMLLLAQYFKASGQHERTLVFVAFSAEEPGLYGSHAMAEWMDTSLTIADINLEMLGRRNARGNNPFITGDKYSDLLPMLNECLRAISGVKDYFVPDFAASEDLYRRSDNFSFAKRGIVAHSIMLSTSGDKYYHTVNDETKSLDYNSMAAIVKNIALATSCLISGNRRPVSFIQQ